MESALHNKKWYINSNFLYLWIGSVTSLLGYRLYLIIMAWFVVETYGSSKILGTLFLFWAVPNMLFMLVGGVLSDKVSKVSLMFYSDLIRSFTLVLLFLCIYFDVLNVALLFVISFVFGTSNALFTPARDAIIPQLIEKEQIQKANAYREITNQMAFIL
ncbi:MAG: MFS transporter, partial [Bacilli bacterium]